MALGFSNVQSKFGADRLNDVLDVKIDKNSSLYTHEGAINDWFDKEFEQFISSKDFSDDKLKLGEKNIETAIDAYFDQADVFNKLVDYIITLSDTYRSNKENIKIELKALDLEITSDGLKKVMKKIEGDKDVTSKKQQAYNGFVSRYMNYMKESSQIAPLAGEIGKIFPVLNDNVFIVFSTKETGADHSLKIKKGDLERWFSGEYVGKNSGFDFRRVVFKQTGEVDYLLFTEDVNGDVSDDACGKITPDYKEYKPASTIVTGECKDCDDDPKKPNGGSGNIPSDVPSGPRESKEREYIPENAGQKYLENSVFCSDFGRDKWQDEEMLDKNQKSDVNVDGEVNLDEGKDRRQVRSAVRKMVRRYGDIGSDVDYREDDPFVLLFGHLTVTQDDKRALKTFNKGIRALNDDVFTVIETFEKLYNTGELQPYFAEAGDGRKEWRGDRKDKKRLMRDTFEGLIARESKISKREARLLYEMGEDFMKFKLQTSGYPVYSRMMGLFGIWGQHPDETISKDVRKLWNSLNNIDAKVQAEHDLKVELEDEDGVGRTLRSWKKVSEQKGLNSENFSREKKKLMKEYARMDRVGVGTRQNFLKNHTKDTAKGDPLYQLVEGRFHGLSLDQIYDTWLLTNATNVNFKVFSYEFGDGYDEDKACKQLETGVLDEYGQGIKHRMIMQMLSDYTLDGKVTHADGAMKSGLQISTSFAVAVNAMRFDRSLAVNESINEIGHENIAYKAQREQKALCNMINYMSKVFVQKGYTDLNQYIYGIGVENVDELWEKFQNSPGLLRRMQEVLQNSSVDVVDIFRYGGEKKSTFDERKDATPEGTEKYWKGKIENRMKILGDDFDKIKEFLPDDVGKDWEHYRHHLQTGILTAVDKMISEGQSPAAIAAAIQPRLKMVEWGSGNVELFANLGAGVDSNAAVSGLVALGTTVNQQLGEGVGVHGTGGVGLAGVLVSTGIRFKVADNSRRIVNDLKDKGVVQAHLTADAFLINGLWGGRVGLDMQRDMLEGVELQYQGHLSKYRKIFAEIGKDITFPVGRTKIGDAYRDVNGKDTSQAFRVQLRQKFDTKGVDWVDQRIDMFVYYLNQAEGWINQGYSKVDALNKVSDDYSMRERNFVLIHGTASQTHWSGMSVGGGIIGVMPFVDASIGLSKYDRPTYETSMISKIAAKHAEWEGVGDERVHASTDEYIAYLNEMVFAVPPMRSYLWAVDKSAQGPDKILHANGFISIPKQLWEENFLNIKVHKDLISSGAIKFEKDYLIIKDSVSMADKTILDESRVVSILNIGYPTGGVDEKDVVELRQGVDVPVGWNGTKEQVANPPPHLSSIVEESEADVVGKGNIEKAIAAFEASSGVAVDLFDTVTVNTDGTFTITKKPNYVIPPEIGIYIVGQGKDLKVTKGVDGKYIVTVEASAEASFDIEYVGDAETFDDVAKIAEINTKIQSNTVLTGAGFKVEKGTADEKVKISVGSTVIVNDGFINGEYVIEKQGNGTFKSGYTNTSGKFVLEYQDESVSVSTEEKPVTLEFDKNTLDDINKLAYTEKVTNKRINAFTLAQIVSEGKKEAYGKFVDALDEGDYGKAYDALSTLVKSTGGGSSGALLALLGEDKKDFMTKNNYEKALILSYFEGLYCSVSAIQQVGEVEFKTTAKDFATLVCARTSGLKKYFGRETSVANEWSVFEGLIKDALALNNLAKEKSMKSPVVEGIGMVFGYNRVDNIDGVAEKFVANPLIFGGNGGLGKVENEKIKKYFVESMMRGTQQHLLDNVVTQLTAEKLGLGTLENLKKLLLGEKVDGFTLERSLGLGFFGRCCNETLVIRDLKLKIPGKTPGGAQISVELTTTGPVSRKFTGGSEPRKKSSPRYISNHIESTNRMIYTGVDKVGFGVGVGLGKIPKDNGGSQPGPDNPVDNPGSIPGDNNNPVDNPGSIPFEGNKGWGGPKVPTVPIPKGP